MVSKQQNGKGKSTQCAVCGHGIETTDVSCPKCSSVPIPIRLVRAVRVLIVIHHAVDEEVQWWNSQGGISAFKQANPKLAKPLIDQTSSIDYAPGILMTSDDLSSLQPNWTEKALSTFEAADSDSVMIQKGGLVSQLPSGVSRQAYLINILVYDTPKGQKPKTHIVEINHQIFPIEV